MMTDTNAKEEALATMAELQVKFKEFARTCFEARQELYSRIDHLEHELWESNLLLAEAKALLTKDSAVNLQPDVREFVDKIDKHRSHTCN